uniref:Ig-like domain-containing protein n=1 Tax=Sinocyclocheilus anshuiensis TaxID=1608454 RepID=A0A671K3C7_9TELE
MEPCSLPVLTDSSSEGLFKTKTSSVIFQLFFLLERLLVSGSDESVSAYDGEDVTLSCSVDSHIKPEHIEKVLWRKTDGNILSRPEAQQQDYYDRAHFFTDQIQHGNFSLRLDNLRAEDEGRYTCRVYSQQDSGETVVQIKDAGE